MGEDTVPAQLTIVFHTVAAKRHLPENMKMRSKYNHGQESLTQQKQITMNQIFQSYNLYLLHMSDCLVLCKQTELFSYPVHGTKVDSFSEVEALVESTVICSGESDDKLTRTLVGTIDLGLAQKERNCNIVHAIYFPLFCSTSH